MRKQLIFILLLTIFILSLNPLHAQSNNPYFQRRQAVLEKMSDEGMLILQTSREGYRFGFNFQQNSDLFYLTGMNNPGLILILSKPGIKSPFDGKIYHSILVIDPPPDNASESQSFYDSLKNNLKYDVVCGNKELRKIFKEISDIDVLYSNFIKKRDMDAETLLEKRVIKLLENMPDVKIRSPNDLTSDLRIRKSEDEITLMQKAIDITMLAHKQAMKSMKPGLYEYQIEAVIEYVFKFNGSQQLAFPSIVGSGPNSLDLHYNLGTRKIEAGDMIVMDIGCEYNHYCADITRTIPATGKFTPEQKEIYNIVLKANEAVIDMLRPGVTMAQMDSTVRAIVSKYGYEKYIRHGCTHYLGLDVHDVGKTRKPLEPGAVVTVEPGLYIPPNSDLPKAYWNIGIRIEDDVLITADGHKVLTSACPKTVKEIEEMMRLEGLGDVPFKKNDNS